MDDKWLEPDTDLGVQTQSDQVNIILRNNSGILVILING